MPCGGHSACGEGRAVVDSPGLGWPFTQDSMREVSTVADPSHERSPQMNNRFGNVGASIRHWWSDIGGPTLVAVSIDAGETFRWDRQGPGWSREAIARMAPAMRCPRCRVVG